MDAHININSLANIFIVLASKTSFSVVLLHKLLCSFQDEVVVVVDQEAVLSLLVLYDHTLYRVIQIFY